MNRRGFMAYVFGLGAVGNEVVAKAPPSPMKIENPIIAYYEAGNPDSLMEAKMALKHWLKTNPQYLHRVVLYPKNASMFIDTGEKEITI
jgi:hypothetical protein